MGSIFNRGTKAKPRWYMQFKENGRFVQRRSKFKLEREAQDELEDVESRIRRGEAGWKKPDDGPTCGELFPTWAAGLKNRNAKDDRTQIDRYLVPMWKHHRVACVTTSNTLSWLDAMREGKAPVVYKSKKSGRRRPTLSGASQRKTLNLLSRFFSWCVERGHAAFNPVRQIPTGSRPQQAVKTDQPWLDDDAVVRTIMDALPCPFGLMFYLGNRSGLRVGEFCGIRMSDFAFLEDAAIRVRFTYDGGFLKEDKRCAGMVKWVPAPEDAVEVLGQWLAKRRAEGAGPEDLVFPNEGNEGKAYQRGAIERAWKKLTASVRKDCADAGHEVPGWISLTPYQATRHSMASDNLSRGASLDEVSAALGHSSPVVTRRFYDHFVRKEFSPVMRRGLGRKASAEAGKLLQFSANAADLLPTLDNGDGQKEKAPGNLLVSEGLVL